MPSQRGVIRSDMGAGNDLLPSNRHVIEVKQNEAIYKKSEADAPSEPINDKDVKTLDLAVTSTLIVYFIS